MGSASNLLDRPNNITITRSGISKRKHVPLSWQPQIPGHSLSLTTETTKCSHEDDKRVMSLYDQMGPTWKQIPDTGLQPITAKYRWQGAKQRRVDSRLAAASSARTAHWASLGSWSASWSSLPKKGKCKTNKQFKKLWLLNEKWSPLTKKFQNDRFHLKHFPFFGRDGLQFCWKVQHETQKFVKSKIRPFCIQNSVKSVFRVLCFRESAFRVQIFAKSPLASEKFRKSPDHSQKFTKSLHCPRKINDGHANWKLKWHVPSRWIVKQEPPKLPAIM